jgi:hypothetical protein
VDLDFLREELERLLLLAEVAERRQELIEKALDEVIESGIAKERIQTALKLSKSSLERLLRMQPPTIAERLGISEETVRNLTQD